MTLREKVEVAIRSAPTTEQSSGIRAVSLVAGASMYSFGAYLFSIDSPVQMICIEANDLACFSESLITAALLCLHLAVMALGAVISAMAASAMVAESIQQ